VGILAYFDINLIFLYCNIYKERYKELTQIVYIQNDVKVMQTLMSML